MNACVRYDEHNRKYTYEELNPTDLNINTDLTWKPLLSQK